jgi:hypothetical protein
MTTNICSYYYLKKSQVLDKYEYVETTHITVTKISKSRLNKRYASLCYANKLPVKKSTTFNPNNTIYYLFDN